MRTYDGSEGGGQLVRSALTLSALTGDAVTVDEIRENRPNPGLKPQHLAAVDALAAICDATVEGADDGSRTLTFEPSEPTGGEYAVDVGTAGSIALVFDAVLPLACVVDDPIRLTVRGGTAVKWSPPLDYVTSVKLPLLRRFGLVASVERERTGYYPKGGGEATVTVGQSTLAPLSLDGRRGDEGSARVVSTCSQSLADAAVAQRQADRATERLAEAGVTVVETTVRTAVTACPGSSVTLRFDVGDAIAGFDALGERGKPAEDVASDAVDAALAWERTSAAVDPHMADQVLVFLAIAGGRVRIPATTAHVESSRDLLAAFDRPVDARANDDGTVTLVGPDRPITRNEDG